MSLTLNDANRRQSFSVAIINDSFYELDVEDFTLVLRIDPVEIPPPSNVANTLSKSFICSDLR